MPAPSSKDAAPIRFARRMVGCSTRTKAHSREMFGLRGGHFGGSATFLSEGHSRRAGGGEKSDSAQVDSWADVIDRASIGRACHKVAISFRGNYRTVRRKPKDLQDKPMELGGFEPPTSWVRYRPSEPPYGLEFPILERYAGDQVGSPIEPDMRGYAPLCGHSGTQTH